MLHPQLIARMCRELFSGALGWDSPLPIASRVTTALRSGDFGSPVLVWSRPRRGEGTGGFA